MKLKRGIFEDLNHKKFQQKLLFFNHAPYILYNYLQTVLKTIKNVLKVKILFYTFIRQQVIKRK